MSIKGYDKIYIREALAKAAEEHHNTVSLPYSEDNAPYSHKDTILAFLQGVLYQWILEHKDKTAPSFVARDLLGGFNNNWAGTPLQFLYDYYYAKTSDNTYAREQAAQDAGWALKEVIKNDPRVKFDNTIKDYYSVRYTFISKINMD